MRASGPSLQPFHRFAGRPSADRELGKRAKVPSSRLGAQPRIYCFHGESLASFALRTIALGACSTVLATLRRGRGPDDALAAVAYVAIYQQEEPLSYGRRGRCDVRQQLLRSSDMMWYQAAPEGAHRVNYAVRVSDAAMEPRIRIQSSWIWSDTTSLRCTGPSG
jgi:hypothetical protein